MAGLDDPSLQWMVPGPPGVNDQPAPWDIGSLPPPPPPDVAPMAQPPDFDPFANAAGLPAPPPPDMGAAFGQSVPMGQQGIPPDLAQAYADMQEPGGAQPPPDLSLGEKIDALTPDQYAAPPPPDALSGVGGMPPTGQFAEEPYAPLQTPGQQYQQAARTYSERPDQLLDELTSGTPNPARQRYLNELALRDPQAYAELQLRFEDTKRKAVAARAQEIANRDWERQQENLHAREQAIQTAQRKGEQLMADAQRLANTKVDPTGGLSGGQKFAGVLMGIIGGLVQGKTGAANNQGLDTLHSIINQRVEAQKSDLARQREGINMRQNELAQEYARSGDLFHAQEVTRMAELQRANDELSRMQQDFAPDGTRGLKIAAMRAGITAQMVQAKRAYEQTQFENNLKESKETRENALARSTIEKNRQETALGWAKFGREGDETQKWTPEQLGILNPGLPLPPIPMSQVGYTKWLATQKEGQQAISSIRGNSPDERAREFGVGEVVDDQGKPVLFRDVAVAGKLADSKGAVDSATQLIDRIVAARQRYGWSSDLLKSPEWRRMQADYGALVLQKKNTDQLGVLSEGDMRLIGKSLGTEDPTEVRDPTAGLKAARENMVNNVNAVIRGQAVLPPGRKLQRWEPPPPQQSTKEKPSETAAKEVLSDPWRNWDAQRLNSELDIDIPALRSRGATSRTVDDARLARFRELGGIFPSQKDTIDGWVDELHSDDPKVRAGAMEYLLDATHDAQLPGVQAYAQNALTTFSGAGIPETPPVPADVRETSHEVMPPKVYPPVRSP